MIKWLITLKAALLIFNLLKVLGANIPRILLLVSMRVAEFQIAISSTLDRVIYSARFSLENTFLIFTIREVKMIIVVHFQINDSRHQSIIKKSYLVSITICFSYYVHFLLHSINVIHILATLY